MSKKITPGWPWTAKEIKFLRQMAKEGISQILAADRLNHKFYLNSKKKRSPSAVANKCLDKRIKFHAQVKGIRRKLVITKKIRDDVAKRLLAHETKDAIGQAYAMDTNIPLTQFRIWLGKQKSRTNYLSADRAVPIAVLENMYQDTVNKVHISELGLKYKKAPDAIYALMRSYKVRRQNLMSEIIMKVPAHDIMLKHGIKTTKQFGMFRKLARSMDFGDDEADLSPAPIWTPDQMKMARKSIIVQADTMRALNSEKRYAKYDIKTDLDYITLLCSGDWHFESMFTDQRALIAACETVKNTEGVYMGFCGDMIDGGIAAGPHKDLMNDAAGSVKLARAAVRGLFFDIKYKLAWINTGCHVRWTIAAADYNPYEEIAKEIRVPYLGPGGTIDINVNDITYRGGVMHKFSGGGMHLTAPCKSYLMKVDASCDFVVVGHNHINAIQAEDWQEKPRVLVRSGSYKEVDTYARILGFQNQETRNPPCIVFGTKTKEMTPFKSLEVGIRTMKAWNSGAKG